MLNPNPSSLFTILCISCILCLPCLIYPAASANNQQRNPNYLAHHVNNHEAEISMLKERLNNQENIMESLRDEVSSLIKASKEHSSKAVRSFEERLSKLDKSVERLITDLKQFKDHANDTTSALTDYQKKVKNLEELCRMQTKQIEHLESALRSIAQAMLGKDPSENKKYTNKDTTNCTSYKVKAGDSLEKIAKAHSTTVTAIRELNQLAKDQIRIGQELKIPQQ